MQNVSKQSGVKVIDSFDKHYKHSLITLTVFYTLTLAMILFISSTVTYSTFSQRVSRRFDRFPPPALIQRPQIDQHLPTVAEVRADFIQSILTVNVILLVLASFLSYFLAQITLRPLKKSHERQRQFLTNASHELRTPLSILQLELENELVDRDLLPIHKERTKSNLEEVGRMSRLVEDILFLSRLDEDNITKTISSVKVTEIIHKSIDRLRTFARARNIGITFYNNTNDDVTLKTDKDLLSRVIINIIKNSIMYNRDGGTVEVHLDANKTKLSIKVVDTGFGIKKENLEKVFDRFYRVDDSRTRKTGGSGLGLYITASSIKHLGGSISIESELEKGTTLLIEFPFT